MYRQAVKYIQNIGVKVIKDNPRFAGYFPYVLRINRYGLDKEKLYDALDSILLPVLEREKEIYSNE